MQPGGQLVSVLDAILIVSPNIPDQTFIIVSLREGDCSGPSYCYSVVANDELEKDSCSF